MQLPLQGASYLTLLDTQGVALGYEQLPFQGAVVADIYSAQSGAANASFRTRMPYE